MNTKVQEYALVAKEEEMDTIVSRGAQVLEDEAPMEEEDVVGIGVEGGAQWRGGPEGGFSSGLKGCVCKRIGLVQKRDWKWSDSLEGRKSSFCQYQAYENPMPHLQRYSAQVLRDIDLTTQ